MRFNISNISYASALQAVSLYAERHNYLVAGFVICPRTGEFEIELLRGV